MCMSMCVCIYMHIYIYFVVRGDFNEHHEMRSASNIWCQRFTMIALICDIVLFEVVATLRGKLVLFPNIKIVV